MSFGLHSAVLPIVALAAAVSVAAAGTSFSGYDAGTKPVDSGERQTAAEIAFADAPYGVDPITTGPVSDSFKLRKQMSGCEIARWPNVPVTCYPD